MYEATEGRMEVAVRGISDIKIIVPICLFLTERISKNSRTSTYLHFAATNSLIQTARSEANRPIVRIKIAALFVSSFSPRRATAIKIVHISLLAFADGSFLFLPVLPPSFLPRSDE